MPTRLSIEVIKHSDDDVRLIIKHGKTCVRMKTNVSDAHKQLMDEIDFSGVFLDYMLSDSVLVPPCEDLCEDL